MSSSLITYTQPHHITHTLNAVLCSVCCVLLCCFVAWLLCCAVAVSCRVVSYRDPICMCPFITDIHPDVILLWTWPCEALVHIRVGCGYRKHACACGGPIRRGRGRWGR